MKISQFVVALLVLLLGVAGIKYSMDQQKVMDLLVAAHGGGPLVEDMDATGLRKINKELETSAADIAKQRSDALAASESARVEMRDARDKRSDAEAQLTRDQEELADWERRNEELSARAQELKKNLNTYMSQLKSADGVDFSTTSDMADMISKIKTFVEEETERTKKLNSDLQEKIMVRKAATQKVADVTAALNEQNAINDRFFDDYCRNGDEFSVLAVSPSWKMVVFQAGKDSGLLPGDSTPLLVKRGNTLIGSLRVVSNNEGMVVAEFDPEKLANGILPAAGDTIIRQKPLGN